MRLVITGGGTGGHLFPGLAVAEAMKRRFPETKILFIGTSRALDQKVLDQADLEKANLTCRGLKGTGRWAKLQSIAMLPGAILQAVKLLKQFQADLVLGVGGYVTGPVLVAAKLMGIPSCIHEQNSVPGFANRLAGKIVDKIFTSIPCGSAFPEKKVVQTGNPVRKEILEAMTAKPRDKKGVTLLVLGGSQGAHRVNALMVEAARILDSGNEQFAIIHQTGEKDAQMVQSAYDALSISTSVHSFITDMAEMYIQADLVVSRAGATSLAEIAVMGLPALLIPYPYAADDHQRKNGEYYAASGGCQVFVEEKLSGEQLADMIKKYLRQPDLLVSSGEKNRTLALPDAAEKIVDQCIKLTMGKRENLF